VARHFVLPVETHQPVEFVDLTADLARLVREIGLTDGLLVVQTRHTTTGLLINEHEPLLLADLAGMFERVAPRAAHYAHDDYSQRTVNLVPGERVNGWAHCQAALMPTTQAVPVAGAELTLGRWQRLFFVELDGGQSRAVSVWLTGRRRSSGCQRSLAQDMSPTDS
jgi:secondary thiamine-phosphate synthase enzyme